MIFRSYKPIDSASFSNKPVQNDDQMQVVERVIEGQLQDTTVTTMKETLVSAFVLRHLLQLQAL